MPALLDAGDADLWRDDQSMVTYVSELMRRLPEPAPGLGSFYDNVMVMADGQQALLPGPAPILAAAAPGGGGGGGKLRGAKKQPGIGKSARSSSTSKLRTMLSG